MSFPRGCLSIRKDSTVESFDYAFNNGRCCVFVNLFLGGIHVKNVVESKFQRLFVFILLFFDYEGVIIKNLMRE